MSLCTRITNIAHERGTNAAELSRKLHLFRSNISLMDAGKRSVSLQLLERVAMFLGCSPVDLLERQTVSSQVFNNKKKMNRILELDRRAPDGSEKAWVHANILAWQNHYRKKLPAS